MVLRVTKYGEPILRQAGKLVDSFDKALARLAGDMVETMYAEEGVGLAAQQIGLAIQLCVVDVSHLPPDELDYLLDGKVPPIDLIMPMALVNPSILVLPGKTLAGEEGCLSFPGVRGDVVRPEKVRVQYQDLKGESHLLEVSGWFARVIQHEVDHLHGQLFIDLMETRALRLLDSKIKKIKRQSRDYLKAQ